VWEIIAVVVQDQTVCLVYLVCFVYLVEPDEPGDQMNKINQINQPAQSILPALFMTVRHEIAWKPGEGHKARGTVG
jgi:hypothetical protein